MVCLLLMLKEVLTELVLVYDAISIMNNSNLIDKKGALKFFLLIYKK